MANENFSNSMMVEIEGTALPDDVKTLLSYAYVDGSRNLPDSFMLQFRDPGQVVIDKSHAKIGSKITLKIQTSDPGGPQKLFEGEVTALGVDLDKTGTFTEIRGYDQAHRLFRGRRCAAFRGMALADVVRKVLSTAGVPVGQIDPVPGIGGDPDTQISQDNVSDWEFLSRLADMVGAQITVTDGKLDFRLPEPPAGAPAPTAKATTEPLALEAHRTLLALRANITAAEQVPKVEVRGWDPKAKQKLAESVPPKAIGTQVDGLDPVALGNKFKSPPFLAADGPRRTQPEVKAAANALAAQLGSACAELEGIARGNPKLRAGTAVTLAGLGKPFAGKYTLTSTRHLFNDQVGYQTEFTVSGRQERSLYGLTSHGNQAGGGRYTGLYPAVVSDAKDPKKEGRVRLTFPWLSDDFTTNWARTVEAGAGKDRGAVVLPEVGDEVLVGFEHGDFDAPYVMGGLFNGKDKMPKLSVEPVDANSGEIGVRAFVSRTGHKLEYIDDSQQKDGIVLATGDGKLMLKLDKKTQMIELTSSKGVKVKADNGVSVDAGTGPLELKGQSVSVKGTTGVKVEGATVSVAAQGQAELTASGVVTVRGSIVKIN
jgi:uncharacterized protein involved in type VI secretion and phage assembly